MEIRTFRAKSMPQALDLIRRELGPEATVLHTREVHGGLLGRIFVGRSYEVAAAPGSSPAPRAAAPADARSSRRIEELPSQRFANGDAAAAAYVASSSTPASSAADQFRAAYEMTHPQTRLPPIESGIDLLGERSRWFDASGDATPCFSHPGLFDAYVQLVEADVDEELARELVEQLRQEPQVAWTKSGAITARLTRLIEQQLEVAGPLRVGLGPGRIVALVGPTGVGKTTTIAKLAANYRLRDNLRVGLITVDTYRIAAVEQLRTYADIIDLPLHVATTPREMREAVAQLRDYDLILMDTAGRSPRDEVKIRELRALLGEARPDEVHLVLSATSSPRSLLTTVDQFAPLGVTSALLTKLDEATSLGAILSLARHAGVPISYLTDGQNVPDDICVADKRHLAESILNASLLPVAVE